MWHGIGMGLGGEALSKHSRDMFDPAPGLKIKRQRGSASPRLDCRTLQRRKGTNPGLYKCQKSPPKVI